VPEEGRFDQVRDALDQELLATIDETFEQGSYELLLPKWETTTNLDLLPWLTEAGAAPGNYPGIDPSAFLAGAVHGADIAVDEEGTVAAAATGLGFEESAAPVPEMIIAADRPYLYVIRHRPSGAVLFAGQMTDPS
jgi:serpin B